MSNSTDQRGYARGRGDRPAQAGATRPAAKPAVVTGDRELWALVQAVRDPATGWSKTTRAMGVPGGVLVNTCTRGPGAATEALVFVPHVAVRRTRDSRTATLVAAV